MKERARRAREGAERACDASDLCVSSRVSNMITIKEEKYWRNIQLFTRSYFVQEKTPVKPDFTGHFQTVYGPQQFGLTLSITILI